MRLLWRGKRVRSFGHSGGGRLWVSTPLAASHPHIRVTQLALEESGAGPTGILVTQLPLEVSEIGTTGIRITQLAVEYIYPFRCFDLPPITPITCGPSCPDPVDDLPVAPSSGGHGCGGDVPTAPL